MRRFAGEEYLQRRKEHLQRRKFINFIQPIRVTSEEEEVGLDATQHNEKYLHGAVEAKSL